MDKAEQTRILRQALADRDIQDLIRFGGPEDKSLSALQLVIEENDVPSILWNSLPYGGDQIKQGGSLNFPWESRVARYLDSFSLEDERWIVHNFRREGEPGGIGWMGWEFLSRGYGPRKALAVRALVDAGPATQEIRELARAWYIRYVCLLAASTAPFSDPGLANSDRRLMGNPRVQCIAVGQRTPRHFWSGAEVTPIVEIECMGRNSLPHPKPGLLFPQLVPHLLLSTFARLPELEALGDWIRGMPGTAQDLVSTWGSLPPANLPTSYRIRRYGDVGLVVWMERSWSAGLTNPTTYAIATQAATSWGHPQPDRRGSFGAVSTRIDDGMLHSIGDDPRYESESPLPTGGYFDVLFSKDGSIEARVEGHLRPTVDLPPPVIDETPHEASSTPLLDAIRDQDEARLEARILELVNQRRRRI